MGQTLAARYKEKDLSDATPPPLTSKVSGKACATILLEPSAAWTQLAPLRRRHDMVVETACGGGGGGLDDQAPPHFSPTVRACEVLRSSSAPGSCGFHLTRSKWDPYPWVGAVEAGSAAAEAGLVSGDCVLEVNGEDVLGLRICEVADKVKARADRVALLLWNSGSDPHCHPESLCCGPMPTNLQRLTTSVSAILAALECPVCLDTIPPPAHQCANGHLICVRCRSRAERCPVCRVRFCRGRSLLADRVFTSLTDAFGLGGEPEDRRAAGLREKLFSGRPRREAAASEVRIGAPKNKFLARVLGKSWSVENLSSTGDPPRGRLAPRDEDADDFAGLKAKSLSTGEIFRPHSPAPVSRSTSVNSAHRVGSGLLLVPGLLGSKRPASYHGSCESFDAEVADDGDDLPCFCPCDAECPVVASASRVLQHVRDAHDGPLVQYFRPKVALALPFPLEDTALVSLADGARTFFLKIAQQAAASSDTLVWAWLLGSAADAAVHQLVLTLRGHGSRGKVLHFRADVLSLAADSWADVVAQRRGVCLPAQTLIDNFATELETGIAINMEVEVKAVTDL